MKRTFFIFVLILVYSIAFSQTISFQKKYKGLGFAVDLTSDSGYVFTGVSYTSPGACLVKLNSYGDTVWTRIFSAMEFAVDVKQNDDGGYILAGNKIVGLNGYDVMVAKTDSLGNLVWLKSFGGTGSEFVRSIQKTNDHGFIIAGETTSFNLTDDTYLIKLDSNGNQLWAKDYGRVDFYGGVPNSVKQTQDGGYLAAGFTPNPIFGGEKGFTIKVDPNGIVESFKCYGYGSMGSDEFNSVCKTIEGGFVFAGTSGSFGAGSYDAYLVKTDSDGNVLWSKTFGGVGDDIAKDVIQTTDSGFVLVGYTNSFGAGGDDVYLIKTNSHGELLWSKTYGQITDRDRGYSVKQAFDGGFIIVGEIGDLSGFRYVYLIKTDSRGNSGCNESNPNSIEGSQSPLDTVIAVATFNGDTLPAPPNIVKRGGIVIPLCSCSMDVSVNLSNSTTFCAGDSIVLTANNLVSNYLWSTSETTRSITVSTTGHYFVTLTDLSGCSLTSQDIAINVDVCTGIEAAEGGNIILMNIFPNPSRDHFTIKVKSRNSSICFLIVHDLAGREIERWSNLNVNENFEFGDKLSKGFYYAEVILGVESKICRFVKD